MKSLRARLVAGLTLGIAALLALSGVVLYVLIRASICAEFDDALASRAQSLGSLIEDNEDGLEFEATEAPLPEFAAVELREYFQIWRPDGSVLARSASLEGRDVARSEELGTTPTFCDAPLPDGRPGRFVWLRVEARRDPELRPAGPPARVVLAFGASKGRLFATLGQVRSILTGVSVFAVLLATAVTGFVVRQSLRPVNELGRQIKQIRADGLSVRVGAAAIPLELSPIVDHLNELLARLKAAFEREQRFTGDAAHELRTPLAGLRSKLELALSRDRSPETYQAALRDCLAINLQSQRIVESLLALARADGRSSTLRYEDVDLEQLARTCWAPMKERALARRLTVEWQVEPATNVRTDRERMALVLHNVLDNAVTYANEGGRLRIQGAEANGAFQLAVSNTGSSVDADQVTSVFDRFWRGDSHNRMSDGHCGLGLSLCKALLDELGGSIRADVSDAGVFSIIIVLNRQPASWVRTRATPRDSEA